MPLCGERRYTNRQYFNCQRPKRLWRTRDIWTGLSENLASEGEKRVQRAKHFPQEAGVTPKRLHSYPSLEFHIEAPRSLPLMVIRLELNFANKWDG
jgi:hypothetical protein